MIEISKDILRVIMFNLWFFIVTTLILQHKYFKYKTKYEKLRLDIMFADELKVLIKEIEKWTIAK